jgi:hypothetical protein
VSRAIKTSVKKRILENLAALHNFEKGDIKFQVDYCMGIPDYLPDTLGRMRRRKKWRSR